MIELHDVTLRAGNFELRDLRLNVPDGAYCVLMGRTGGGKTTILEAICGLRPVVRGTIRVGGRDVTRLRPGERGMGYVPQDLALFPTLTVREHLEFALRLRRASAALLRERVEEMSALLGIGKLLDRKPQGLSGGEAQRVALGRALSFHPPVLLLDEPLSALDEETRGGMYELLKRVRSKTGVTTLHVTHSQAEAKALGEQIAKLDGGRLSMELLTNASPEG